MIGYGPARNNSTFFCADCEQMINDKEMMELAHINTDKGTAMHRQHISIQFHKHCFYKLFGDIAADIRYIRI